MNTASPISSPCIDICDMDPNSGLCAGCARSMGEIMQWGMIPETARRRIMAELPQRLDMLGEKAADPAEAKAHIKKVLEQ